MRTARFIVLLCIIAPVWGAACKKEEQGWAKTDQAVRRPPPPSRCEPTMARSLKFFVGDELRWEKDNEELANGSRTIEIAGAGRRLQGRKLLSLAALLEGEKGVAEVEVVPCSGGVHRYSPAEVVADERRFVFLRTGRGFFKFLDLKAVLASIEEKTGEAPEAPVDTAPSEKGTGDGSGGGKQKERTHVRNPEVAKNIFAVRLLRKGDPPTPEKVERPPSAPAK